MKKKAFIFIMSVIMFYFLAAMYGVATGRIVFTGDDPLVSVAGEKAESETQTEPVSSSSEGTRGKPESEPELPAELTLVSAEHPLPEGYECELVTLSNGNSVSALMYPDLQRMFDDMRAEGLDPTVGEGFRTRDEQARILSEKQAELAEQGLTEEKARREALRWAALPGTSEHELGLAVDVNSLGGEQEQAVYAWLAENAHTYGFILRYPDGKEEITGIGYEPWHYRYVGTQAAQEMHEKGQTLEEYLIDR